MRLAMYLVLTICAATLIGGTFGHGSGNFMASTPCFSFQGQNILWPAGPQGFAGVSNPFGFPNVFKHPFFNSGAGGRHPGEPIEASSPASHPADDHTGPVAQVAAPPTASIAHPDVVNPSSDNHGPIVGGAPAPIAEVPHAEVAVPAPSPTVVEPVAAPAVIEPLHAPESAHAPVIAEPAHAPAVVEAAHDSVHAAADHAPAIVVSAPSATVTDASHSPAVVDAAHAPAHIEHHEPTVVAASAPVSHHVTDAVHHGIDASVAAIPHINTPIDTATGVRSHVHHEEASASSEEPATHDAGKSDKHCSTKKECACGCNSMKLPPLVETCKIGSLNFSDLGYSFPQDPWNTCGFPNLHALPAHGFPLHPYDLHKPCGIDAHHFIGHDSILHHDHHLNPLPFDYPCHAHPVYDTKLLSDISALHVGNISDICNMTEIEKLFPCHKIAKNLDDHKCALPHPIGHEFIANIPCLDHLKHKDDSFIHHLPLFGNQLGAHVDKRLCHIPITHQYTRPIVESSLSHVPCVASHIKPVIHHGISTLPVTEKRISPAVHESLVPHYNDGLVCGASHVHHYGDNFADGLPFNAGQINCGHSYPFHNYEGVDTIPEQHIEGLRKQLYLPQQIISHEHDYGHEDGRSVAPEEFSDPRVYGQELSGNECVGPCRSFEEEERPQEFQPMSADAEGSISAPLAHSIPFPEQSAGDVSEDVEGYSQHPDYCD